MRTLTASALALALLAASACSKSAPPPESATPAAAAPSVKPKHPAFFGVSIVYMPEPIGHPAAIARELAAADPPLTIVDRPSDKLAGPSLYIHTLTADEIVPLDADFLRRFGRGLNDEQVVKLLESKAAILLGFVAPDPRQIATVRRAGELALALAERTGGVLYDEETREYFSPQAWRTQRIDNGWDGDLPAAEQHITIHAYPDGDLLRAVTLGMAKFGCPDVVVEQFARSDFRTVGSLVNLVAQTLVEADGVPAGPTLHVDMRSLRLASARKSYTESLFEGGSGVGDLAIGEGKPQEGDPDNPLIELTFADADAPTSTERQQIVLAALFGAANGITRISGHDDAIKAASAAARAVLIEMKKPLFLSGLPAGDRLMVKGPFRTPAGGNEWMWVEVTRWEGDTLHGVLMNDPFDVPDLKAGAPVSVKEAVAFDYIYYKSDGAIEGNTTAELIEQREK